MKNILFLSLFFFVSAGYGVNAQDLPRSAHSGFCTVDAEQARQLAVKSAKDMTLFYTYADWCSSCRKELPEVVSFAKQHDIDLYLLLVDKEDDSGILRTGSMIDTVYHKALKTVVITDSLYTPQSFKRLNAPIRKYIQINGKRYREKYTQFLEQITPEGIEVINDMGKKILLNRSGEVLLVTSYKDEEEVGGYSKLLEGKVAACIKRERTGKK